VPLARDSLFYTGCQFLSQFVFILLFRMRVWGVEKLPRHGGVLLASNHQSFLDPVVVGLGLPRQLHYLARRSLFDIPLFRRLIRAVNAFPIERGKADRGAIRAAIRVLSQGRALLLFPEGTRTWDGRVGPFRPGFAMVAARAGARIVPVAIDGAFEAWPRARRLPHAGRVRVAYGEPVAPPPAEKGACAAAAEEVRGRVLALREALRHRE